MSAPFLLEIPPRGQIEEIGQHSRIQYIGYYGDPEREHAVEAIFRSLEEFAADHDNLSMVSAALTRCAPELMAIATVLTLNQLPKMEDADALPLLTKMREIGQPEWARTIAGNHIAMLDQHAVCDASEVEG